MADEFGTVGHGMLLPPPLWHAAVVRFLLLFYVAFQLLAGLALRALGLEHLTEQGWSPGLRIVGVAATKPSSLWGSCRDVVARVRATHYGLPICKLFVFAMVSLGLFWWQAEVRRGYFTAGPLSGHTEGNQTFFQVDDNASTKACVSVHGLDVDYLQSRLYGPCQLWLYWVAFGAVVCIVCEGRALLGLDGSNGTLTMLAPEEYAQLAKKVGDLGEHMLKALDTCCQGCQTYLPLLEEGDLKAMEDDLFGTQGQLVEALKDKSNFQNRVPELRAFLEDNNQWTFLWVSALVGCLPGLLLPLDLVASEPCLGFPRKYFKSPQVVTAVLTYYTPIACGISLVLLGCVLRVMWLSRVGRPASLKDPAVRAFMVVALLFGSLQMLLRFVLVTTDDFWSTVKSLQDPLTVLAFVIIAHARLSSGSQEEDKDKALADYQDEMTKREVKSAEEYEEIGHIASEKLKEKGLHDTAERFTASHAAYEPRRVAEEKKTDWALTREALRDLASGKSIWERLWSSMATLRYVIFGFHWGMRILEGAEIKEKQRRMLLELRAIPYLVGLLREIAERKFIDYLHGKELIDRLDVEGVLEFLDCILFWESLDGTDRDREIMSEAQKQLLEIPGGVHSLVGVFAEFRVGEAFLAKLGTNSAAGLEAMVSEIPAPLESLHTLGKDAIRASSEMEEDAEAAVAARSDFMSAFLLEVWQYHAELSCESFLKGTSIEAAKFQALHRKLAKILPKLERKSRSVESCIDTEDLQRRLRAVTDLSSAVRDQEKLAAEILELDHLHALRLLEEVSYDAAVEDIPNQYAVPRMWDVMLFHGARREKVQLYRPLNYPEIMNWLVKNFVDHLQGKQLLTNMGSSSHAGLEKVLEAMPDSLTSLRFRGADVLRASSDLGEDTEEAKAARNDFMVSFVNEVSATHKGSESEARLASILKHLVDLAEDKPFATRVAQLRPIYVDILYTPAEMRSKAFQVFSQSGAVKWLANLMSEAEIEDVDVDYAAKLLVYVFDPREPSVEIAKREADFLCGASSSAVNRLVGFLSPAAWGLWSNHPLLALQQLARHSSSIFDQILTCEALRKMVPPSKLEEANADLHKSDVPDLSEVRVQAIKRLIDEVLFSVVRARTAELCEGTVMDRAEALMAMRYIIALHVRLPESGVRCRRYILSESGKEPPPVVELAKLLGERKLADVTNGETGCLNLLDGLFDASNTSKDLAARGVEDALKSAPFVIDWLIEATSADDVDSAVFSVLQNMVIASPLALEAILASKALKGIEDPWEVRAMGDRILKDAEVDRKGYAEKLAQWLILRPSDGAAAEVSPSHD